MGSGIHGMMNRWFIAAPPSRISVAVLQGRALGVVQEERISKHAKQITEICRFAVGMSLILKTNGFKITSNILEALSEITRFILHIIITRRTQHALPECDRSCKAYFYDAEKQDIVFKKLIVFLASASKAFLEIVPQLVRLQVLPKLLPYFSLFLDFTELMLKLVLNYKKLTENGLTSESVFKIAAALVAPLYHIASCVVFMIASSIGGTFACILLINLAIVFYWLVEEGMKDTALFMQPLDKLLLNGKIANELAKSIHSSIGPTDESIKNIALLMQPFDKFLFNNRIANKLAENFCSFIKPISFIHGILSQEVFQQRSNDARKLYLSVIGLNVCMGTILRRKKVTKDSNGDLS
ncbi:MAG: hypothetical protein LBI47_01035 [Puniceicoccales bacterium]|jgi:hypothetical protein|nr:hypothetical protein [Puniceicoccales bacterium]